MVAMPSVFPSWLDTVERAIVWGATLLRASNLSQGTSFKYYNSVRLSISIDKSSEEYLGLVNLEVNLTYSSEVFLLSGGDFLPAILPFSESAFPAFNYQCPPDESAGATLAQPKNIVSLEQFLFWACSILYASNPLNNPYVSFQFFEEKKDGAIAQFKLKLPFNYSAWIKDKNIICALQRTVQTYTYPQKTYGLDSLGNSGSVDNNFVLGN